MTEKIRILIVDDEITIRELLYKSLISQNYEVNQAKSGLEALETLKRFHPHLVILDLGLPDISGNEVLHRIRQWSRVPIIVLTVNDSEGMKVQTLDSGADDYLTKPFSMSELYARVRVSIRNVGIIEATPIFISGDLKVDLSSHFVSVENKEIKLTPTEFAVLSSLVRDHGKVLTVSHLLKSAWGTANEDQAHYLRIYINQLRKKIEKDPAKPKHIITEAGVGYRLV